MSWISLTVPAAKVSRYVVDESNLLPLMFGAGPRLTFDVLVTAGAALPCVSAEVEQVKHKVGLTADEAGSDQVVKPGKVRHKQVCPSKVIGDYARGKLVTLGARKVDEVAWPCDRECAQ